MLSLNINVKNNRNSLNILSQFMTNIIYIKNYIDLFKLLFYDLG